MTRPGASRVRRWTTLCLVVLASATGAAQGTGSSRSFHLGFTPLPPIYSDYGRGIVYSYLQREGDLISHTLQHGVPWNEALHSSDWRTYPAGLRAMWEDIALYDGYFLPNHRRYVSIHPINYGYDGVAEYWGDQTTMPLEGPWAGYAFNHPEVKQAFLNYAIATVEFFQPTYLGLGVEVNILLARAPWAWYAYKELNAFVYDELKRRYPDLQVFTTVQYEHMLGLQYDSKQLLAHVGSWWPTVLVDEARSLLSHSDLFVLSTYPYMAYAADADRSHYDMALAISQQTGRRIAIEQTGYTSEPIQIYYSLLVGTEALQASYVTMLLAMATEHEFAFLVNFVAIDYARNYGDDAIALTWAYTGLFRPDGTPKPAADVWRSHVLRTWAPSAAMSPPD